MKLFLEATQVLLDLMAGGLHGFLYSAQAQTELLEGASSTASGHRFDKLRLRLGRGLNLNRSKRPLRLSELWSLQSRS